MTDRLGAGTRGGDEYPTDKEMGVDGPEPCEHDFEITITSKNYTPVNVGDFGRESTITRSHNAVDLEMNYCPTCGDEL